MRDTPLDHNTLIVVLPNVCSFSCCCCCYLSRSSFGHSFSSISYCLPTTKQGDQNDYDDDSDEQKRNKMKRNMEIKETSLKVGGAS